MSKVDLRLQCGMPCSKLEVSTVQHGTLSGAGYLHQSPHGLRIGSSRLNGRGGPLAAFTRRGHGFLSADGPLARQGIRTVTSPFEGDASSSTECPRWID